MNNPANAIQRRYVHGPGSDEPILWYEGSGTSDRRYLLSDERGSVIAVTNAAGSLIAANSYDEYGIPAPGNMGRFQYTGQTWLPELGMYYYKARIYSPTMGRFLQTDPIGYADGMNIYAYVGNDPVNGRDPSGMACEPTPDTTECVENTPIIATGYRLGVGSGSYAGSNGTNGNSTGSSGPATPPGHYYDTTARLCTASPGKPCHLERTNTKACVLPGRISTGAVVTGNLYVVYASYAEIFPTGVVRTTQTGPNSYRNTTTWAHPLSGTIDRVFSQDADGNVNVRTIGQGTAATRLQDNVNQARGPSIFDTQNQVCSAIVGGQ